MDWPKPEALEELGKIVKDFALVATALAKLKQVFSKKGKSKRDLKKVGDEIDELQEAFLKLLELFAKHVAASKKQSAALADLVTTLSNPVLAKRLATEFSNSAKITKIVLSHNERLEKVEELIKTGQQ